MSAIGSLWRHLTEPAVSIADPEERRRLRLLLSILYVVALLGVFTLAATPLRLLAPLSPRQHQTATVILPAILAVFAPLLVACILLARRGRYKTSARILVAYGSAASFLYIIVSGDASSLSMPVLALVLCSLLLTPLDTVASFLVTVVGYVVLDMVVPGLTSWEVVSTLIIVGAVGALSTAEASVRRQDLKHIEGQAAELRKRQNQLVEAQKMEAVARLSSGVAHEFNNILTMINGYAEVIDRRPADDPTIYTARIREAGTRAARLTEGLLAFSQQQLLHLQSADLDKLLKNQGPFLRSVLRKETHLAMDFSPEAKTIEIDVDQFSETLRALLQAAEENLTVGGSLSIGTRTIDLSTNDAMLLPEGAYCTVEIFDNGPAKDQEVQSRLFNPFFTTGEFGSGRLDLAAAYGLVRQLGGQIEMKSEPGRGNTIVVVLPRRGIVT